MGKRNLDLTKPVKLKNPMNKDEEKLVFKIVNYNAITERIYIQQLNSDFPFLPQELVSIEDVVNV